MKFVLLIVFSFAFLSLWGQEIGLTLDGKPNVEQTPDSKGIIFRDTLIYHNWKGNVISQEKYYHLANTRKFAQIVNKGKGDTLNFGFKSYKPSLYKHEQLPLVTLQGQKGKLITPGDKGRPVIFAFWMLSCGWLPFQFLNMLDSLACKHPEVDIIAIALFPNSREMAENMSYKYLKVISDYRYEYEKYFTSGNRLLS